MRKLRENPNQTEFSQELQGMVLGGVGEEKYAGINKQGRARQSGSWTDGQLRLLQLL